MDEVDPVERVQGTADRLADGQDSVGAGGTSLLAGGADPGGQVAPVGQVEYQVGLGAFGLADVVDGEKVCSVDASLAAALFDEALPYVGVEAVVLGEDLHGDIGAQPLVGRAVDGGEATHPDDLTDPVAPDPVGCRPAHRRSISLAATRARPRATRLRAVLWLMPSRRVISL